MADSDTLHRIADEVELDFFGIDPDATGAISIPFPDAEQRKELVTRLRAAYRKQIDVTRVTAAQIQELTDYNRHHAADALIAELSVT